MAGKTKTKTKAEKKVTKKSVKVRKSGKKRADKGGKKPVKSVKTLEMKLKKSDLNIPKKGDLIEDFGNKYLNLLLTGKKAAKEEIYHFLTARKGKDEVKIPLIVIFATDLNGEKELIGREDLFKMLEALMVIEARVVVVDTQQPSDINNLGELEEMILNHIVWYNPKTDNSGRHREEKEIDRLLLAADVAVLLKANLELIRLLMSYGVVLVAQDKFPLLDNYRPNEETGNAFVYEKKSHWSIFAAIVRAIETHKFPYDWKNIVKKIYR